MTKKYRTYTEEFKRDAVKLMETSGKSVVDISKDLDVHQSVLRRWRNKYGQGQPHQDTRSELEAENKRLRRELRVVQEERDILKKAISIFSRK